MHLFDKTNNADIKRECTEALENLGAGIMEDKQFKNNFDV